MAMCHGRSFTWLAAYHCRQWTSWNWLEPRDHRVCLSSTASPNPHLLSVIDWAQEPWGRSQAKEAYKLLTSPLPCASPQPRFFIPCQGPRPERMAPQVSPGAPISGHEKAECAKLTILRHNLICTLPGFWSLGPETQARVGSR